MSVLKNCSLILLIAFTLFNCKRNDSNNNQHKKTNIKKPNIIYILTDDLGYGDISAFNKNSKISTPNIDSLATAGIKFTDAHTTSSVCTPSRYSILTGRYAWRTRLKAGVLTGKSKALIPENRTTIAALLKSKGYFTSFIGKWHLGWNWALKDTTNFGGKGWNAKDFENIDFSKPIKNSPNDLGFDYAYGHAGSLDMGPYVYVENRYATQIPKNLTENTGNYEFWRKGPTASDFIHEEVTPHFFNKTINLIKEKATTKKPFFIYLALPSPHTPILPSKKWQGKSGLNPYGDFVLMIDDYIGKIVKTIKNTGIEDNTLLVFTSDNGCAPSANFEVLLSKNHSPSGVFRGAKADIFEGGHRVPFIMKWPKKIKKNTISSEIITTADFFATCAEITDYSLADNEGEDSKSLLPILTKKDYKPIHEAIVNHSVNGSFAIRKDKWKLIMCPGSGGWSFPTPKDIKVIESLPKMQLYNLETDPSETLNLVDKKPELVSSLKNLLKEYIINGRTSPGKKQENDSFKGPWHKADFIKN